VEVLEEELWAVEEYGEAAQACILELVRDSVGKSKISLVFNSNLIFSHSSPSGHSLSSEC